MSEADPVVDEGDVKPAIDPAVVYERTMFVRGDGYSVDQLTPQPPFDLATTPILRFRGHGILNPGTPAAMPFEFEIEAKTLAEAFEEFEVAMKKGVEEIIERAKAAQKKIQLAGAGPIADFRAMRARRRLGGNGGGRGRILRP